MLEWISEISEECKHTEVHHSYPSDKPKQAMFIADELSIFDDHRYLS